MNLILLVTIEDVEEDVNRDKIVAEVFHALDKLFKYNSIEVELSDLNDK